MRPLMLVGRTCAGAAAAASAVRSRGAPGALPGAGVRALASATPAAALACGGRSLAAAASAAAAAREPRGNTSASAGAGARGENWTLYGARVNFGRAGAVRYMGPGAGAHGADMGRAGELRRMSSGAGEIVREKLRNIAVIAHVDHGKTTLVDKMMAQCGEMSSNERFMDELDLEKERGITIMAKCTSLFWNDNKINLVDTPGHADFGGEVERVMSMVDGVLLLVDAAEGPMAQTKFVLTKALKRGIRPIVVINKVDKDTQRVDEVESEVFDLFAFLDATEEQLNFPVLYASGRSGWADKRMDGPRKDMKALLDTIVEHVPPPQGDPAKPFSMSVVMLGSDHFLGRLLTGSISSGIARVNDPVIALNRAGEKVDTGRITKILTRQGDLGRVSLEMAIAGDIVQIAGLAKASVSDTICSPEVKEPIPTIPIDPPTVCMTFGPNDSPLQGREGKKLTSQLIWDRLVKETENNVSIQVKRSESSSEAFEVYGRGELQLGILVENMRREGFELQISPPQVVYRMEGGKTLEPVEEVTIEVEDEFVGPVVNKLNARKGIVKEMRASNQMGRTRVSVTVPTRGLLGYRTVFFTDTRGTGILTRLYIGHEPHYGAIDHMRKGVLVCMAPGKTTGLFCYYSRFLLLL
jgi:GTP-binding protein